jgi:5-dehydro-2-deoxygluconokinase
VSAGPPFDVLTIGRVGVDFYPTTHGSIVEVQHFAKFLGGSPTNVAVAAARLGERAAVITRTGPDPLGEYVHAALRDFGVDDRYVTSVDGLQTPVTFCETFPPDRFPIYFYRAPKAPDLEIYPEELDLDAIRAARLFWATVSGLSAEPSRTATMAALAARSRRHPTMLDLDYRPSFWSSSKDATEATGQALMHATIAVGNLEEVNVAVGTRDPDGAADRILELGLELAVVKLGPDGVMAKSRDERVEVPPVPVKVVNGLGAGDAFGGSLCHGVLAGWPLADTLRFASAAGAIVASKLACSQAMPTALEVEDILRRGTT